MSLTIVIPVHEFNDAVSTYLTTALKSIGAQVGDGTFPEVLLVYASRIKSDIKAYLGGLELPFQVGQLENDGLSSFQGQINAASLVIKTDYFSILEFDDELSTKYYKNFQVYTQAYPNVELFLPIIVETNEQSQALKLTNEPVWSRQFVGENGVVGFLNAKALAQYTDFKISGGIFKTSEFIGNGKLKTKIDLTFSYEYLLRSVNNGGKIFVIPKTIYKHVATRPDSLFANYAATLTLQERKFWFDMAKKESNFMTDRDIDKSPLILQPVQ